MLDIAYIPAPPITSQMIADDLLSAQREAKAADAAYDATLGHMLRGRATPAEAAEAFRRSEAADARLTSALSALDRGAK
jgi:hypothetical protein